MRALLASAIMLLLSAPASAQWTRVDTNYGLTEPYTTDLVGADADNLYALVLTPTSTPAMWNVLRSPDDGDSWSTVRTMPSGNTVEGSFLGDLNGLLVASVLNGPTTAAVHLSDDGGTTWTEATSVPSQLIVAFGRDGDVLLATGLTTFLSPDRGATWQAIGGTSNQGFIRVAHFAGAFWAPDQAGFLYRLSDGATSWERASSGPTGILGIWIDGSTLWVKGRTSLISPLSLFSTTDGVTWTAQPTAQPDAYAEAYPAPPNDDPWFLPSEATNSASTHFLSSYHGVSVIDITTGYPRSSNGFACVSSYTATATAAVGATTGGVGGSTGCTPGTDANAGVYRYSFGGSTAAEGTREAGGLAITLAPNPTRGIAAVRLQTDTPGPVAVDLYDALGRHMAHLGDGERPVGEITFAVPESLTPGVYVVRAVAGQQIVSRTLTVVR